MCGSLLKIYLIVFTPEAASAAPISSWRAAIARAANAIVSATISDEAEQGSLTSADSESDDSVELSHGSDGLPAIVVASSQLTPEADLEEVFTNHDRNLSLNDATTDLGDELINDNKSSIGCLEHRFIIGATADILNAASHDTQPAQPEELSDSDQQLFDEKLSASSLFSLPVLFSGNRYAAHEAGEDAARTAADFLLEAEQEVREELWRTKAERTSVPVEAGPLFSSADELPRSLIELNNHSRPTTATSISSERTNDEEDAIERQALAFIDEAARQEQARLLLIEQQLQQRLHVRATRAATRLQAAARGFVTRRRERIHERLAETRRQLQLMRHRARVAAQLQLARFGSAAGAPIHHHSDLLSTSSLPSSAADAAAELAFQQAVREELALLAAEKRKEEEEAAEKRRQEAEIAAAAAAARAAEEERRFAEAAAAREAAERRRMRAAEVESAAANAAWRDAEAASAVRKEQRRRALAEERQRMLEEDAVSRQAQRPLALQTRRDRYYHFPPTATTGPTQRTLRPILTIATRVATRIQAMWRGRGVRCGPSASSNPWIAHKARQAILQRNAATLITAVWKGHRLRKRFRDVLASCRYDDSDGFEYAPIDDLDAFLGLHQGGSNMHPSHDLINIPASTGDSSSSSHNGSITSPLRSADAAPRLTTAAAAAASRPTMPQPPTAQPDDFQQRCAAALAQIPLWLSAGSGSVRDSSGSGGGGGYSTGAFGPNERLDSGLVGDVSSSNVDVNALFGQFDWECADDDGMGLREPDGLTATPAALSVDSVTVSVLNNNTSDSSASQEATSAAAGSTSAPSSSSGAASSSSAAIASEDAAWRINNPVTAQLMRLRAQRILHGAHATASVSSQHNQSAATGGGSAGSMAASCMHSSAAALAVAAGPFDAASGVAIGGFGSSGGSGARSPAFQARPRGRGRKLALAWAAK